MTLRSPVRPAYTLLEMILAMTIALIILAAAYSFLDVQMSNAELGREVVDEAALIRSVLNAVADDVAACLGGVDPQQSPAISSDPTQAALDLEAFAPSFNFGVKGSSNSVTLSVSRVPRELLASDKRLLDSASLPTVSGLRQITYWFIDDEMNGGLARNEQVAVTSTDIGNPTATSDPKIMASEVKGVLFEYYDGGTWQSSWDGTQLAADGQTPLGPPSAIRVTLTLRSKDGQRTRDYQHVVLLQAGNNWMAQQLGI